MPDSEDPKQVSSNDLRNSQFGGGFINAETVNAGRVGGDIWNIFFGQQTTTPVGDPARPKNERILLAAVKEEVTARLRQSLHNAVLINLGKEAQPQQVKRPWDAEIKIGLKPAVPLPNTTTILSVFESEEIAGKLLILGEPGAGKTTTQLELAQELTKRAEEQPDCPVPVLFNLSSWKDDRQSLTNWLLAELKSKYGVSIKLGEEWVNNHQLLPLLDGLDELEPQRQELCVHEINQFLAGETRPLYLVVCSRIEEYSNYSTQLQLNGAIYLQPLTNNQICDYLTNIKYTELWSTISSDLDLLELVKTPLLLSVTVLASQEISVEEWQHLNSTADRIQYLLDAYVGRMFTRNINSRAYLKNKTPNSRKTRMWLVWLAKQISSKSESEFLIEEIQPNFLAKKAQLHIYKVIYTLIVVLVTILIGVMIGGLIGQFFTKSDSSIYAEDNGIITGLFLGLFLGLFYAFWNINNTTNLVLIETINLFKVDKENLTCYIIFGIIGGAISGIFLLAIYGIKGVFAGVMLGFTLGVIYGLILGQSKLVIKTKTKPNQGIWKSASNSFYIALLGLILGGTYGLIIELNYGLITGFIGLSLGLFIGGGNACIQHFCLRLILYRNGYIPWNYARFLDYCTERLFLQRVGGRYRFIHKLLQDHFAKMEFKRD